MRGLKGGASAIALAVGLHGAAVAAQAPPLPADTSPQAAPPAGPKDANGQDRAAPPPAVESGAQSGATISEIIVTAQRRDQSLARTPVAVTVISADTLAKAQVVTQNDLRQAAPGLQVRSAGNSNQLNFALRGESQDPFSNVRPGVLPYINDVQIGGAGGASAFYDLQSVQVLKGPQGTLFGRSATGGAILFTTAKPNDSLGGYFSALGGDYSQRKFEGAVNVPIIDDRLKARVAAVYLARDGFQDNLYNGQTVGDQEQYGGRLSVTAKVTSNLTNEFVADVLHSDSQNTVAVLSGLLPFTGAPPPFFPTQLLYSGTATPTATITGECTLQALVGFGACPPVAAPVSGFYQGYFSTPGHPANGISAQLAAQNARGPYVINSDAANIFRTDNVVVTNTTSYDLTPNIKIKNIFGFVSIRSLTSQESDGTPYNIASGTGLASDTRQTSDELQVLGKSLGNRLDYVAGFYYSNETSTTRQDSSFFDLLFGGLTQENHFKITNLTYAGYAQGTYRLNDSGLSATVGARYTSEDVGIDILPGDTIRGALGPVPPPGFSYDQSKTYDKLSWTIGLQEQFNPSLLFYVDSRRAYKSGGFNGIVQPKIGLADVTGDAYQAERVTDVEVGSKFSGRVFGLPARADVDFFYNWVKNSQRAAFTLVNGGPAGLTVNVPNGATYGIEFDGQVKPLSWLTLGLNANYTDASFGSAPVAINGQSQVFDQVPDTPSFTGSVYGDITYPISSELDVFTHGDLYYQSDELTSPRSLNYAGTRIAPYGLTNLRAGVENAKAGWTLTLNVKNAFNRRYYAGGVATGEIYQVNLLVPGEPRTFTVEIRKKF